MIYIMAFCSGCLLFITIYLGKISNGINLIRHYIQQLYLLEYRVHYPEYLGRKSALSPDKYRIYFKDILEALNLLIPKKNIQHSTIDWDVNFTKQQCKIFIEQLDSYIQQSYISTKENFVRLEIESQKIALRKAQESMFGNQAQYRDFCITKLYEYLQKIHKIQ